MTDATVTPEVQPSAGSELAPQLGKFLDEYDEIVTILPVVAGLLVTSRLRLRGAQALLVNLLMAAIIRQVVGQLKRQAHATPATVQTADAPASDKNGATPGQQEDYTIVHSVPGRIRLRIPRLTVDALYAKRLEKLLSEDSRVKYVRINRAASSLVIQYDGAGVSELELGIYLLNILEQAEAIASETTS
ncbi:HMA2 domain-containing protein [Lyngbya sp. CCY1209]|uniref:HMA2 domain-containing protein n=1 Tax=Lyngbya sp. CCY1209 TaxID=2886103 RepID=UPI002D213B78|nr:hypothetical protein [Lyngbya sp. CCY1209]MEB3884291.1 hypothetical protein [Lyngbya sp. CCY1209]